MKTQTTHTPTLKLPLKVGGIMNINGDHMRRIDESDGMVVAFVTDQNLVESEAIKVRDEIAEKFTRAVNSHEALLEAAKAALEAWESGKGGGEAFSNLRNSIAKASKDAQ